VPVLKKNGSSAHADGAARIASAAASRESLKFMILLLDRSDLYSTRRAAPVAEASIVLLATQGHYPVFTGPRGAGKRRSCTHATRFVSIESASSQH
jgi:hypothetical protein